jgi:hypothetical protein
MACVFDAGLAVVAALEDGDARIRPARHRRDVEVGHAADVDGAKRAACRAVVLKCAKSDGIRDYFHVGVIGYGGKVSQQIGGAVVGQRLVPVSVIANHPARIEQREKIIQSSTGEMVKQTLKFPVWFDAIATGKTPMCEAMTQTFETLAEFLHYHPDCYPPVVVHLTDGMPTDGNPLSKSKDVRELASSDGNVLLFNIHLSSKSWRHSCSRKASHFARSASDSGIPIRQ